MLLWNIMRCFVSFYKKFSSYWLVEMNVLKLLFYLVVCYNWWLNEEVWYMKVFFGKNEIVKFLFIVVKNVGFYRGGKM